MPRLSPEPSRSSPNSPRLRENKQAATQREYRHVNFPRKSIPLSLPRPSRKALITASPQKGDFPNRRQRAIDSALAFSYGALASRASPHLYETKRQESGAPEYHRQEGPMSNKTMSMNRRDFLGGIGTIS